MRRIIIHAALAALAACGSSGGGTPPPTANPPPAAHRPDAGAPDSGAPSKGYIGVIAAAQSMDVAPLVSGVIATVNVHAGDQVKAGDVIAEMDPTSMQEELRAAQAAVGAADAAYRQAAVDVEDARRKLTLEKKAVADGVSPRQNVEEAALAVRRAIAAADHAAANIASEKSRLQTARDHVGNTKLEAKFDGTVELRFKDAGATVSAGEAIVRIFGRTGLRLRFAVPPERANTLAIGTAVTATVDTISTPVPAVVQQKQPSLDPASGMILVEAVLTDDPAITSQLRPGLAAWVPLS